MEHVGSVPEVAPKLAVLTNLGGELFSSLGFQLAMLRMSIFAALFFTSVGSFFDLSSLLAVHFNFAVFPVGVSPPPNLAWRLAILEPTRRRGDLVGVEAGEGSDDSLLLLLSASIISGS